jgi:Mrp family chromosome partitioning ATPase
MTQSPPKASSSSRPPDAPGITGNGRLITSLAAGGSVLLLSSIAVIVWPRTYSTEATFVLDGAPSIANPTALAGRIEAALLERQELAGVAMELPPELRSPDPIGRLRAGIRVQSHGALAYGVEFRGSGEQSVQRIANRLADRALVLLPGLAASPEDRAPAQALATRTRAVTEFLTAHPEMSLEATGGKPAGAADSGLEALRIEQRQIELRLATGAADNPYTDPGQTPEILNRRLAELKTTIARREKALREPHGGATAGVAPELVTKWRELLADLATAQAAATARNAAPPVSGHMTARAPLPTSPLTPNRLVLSIVAVLLSAAAAMAAYALPRGAEPLRRKGQQPAPPKPSEPPPPQLTAGSEPPPAKPSEPPTKPSEPPAKPSEPPPRASGSEPPGPIAVQRTVVLSAPSGAKKAERKRSKTSPGGMAAPDVEAPAVSPTALATTSASHPPPAAPLFGSRPPPGAGSYSVSSSHPPAAEPRGVAGRTSVERLSPLLTAHPPTHNVASTSRRGISPSPQAANAPQIVSLPPALDPDAEIWAARFETPPPPPPEAAPVPAPEPEPVPSKASDSSSSNKRAGRWKTQVMGSMVPLEVMEARERLPQRALESVPPPSIEPVKRQAPSPTASTTIHQDMPLGWRPNLSTAPGEVAAVRDAILKHASGRRLTLLVTGAATSARAHVASALGLGVSEGGARVLLVEADFDSPGLHHALAFTTPPGAGFSQQLMARRQAKQPEPWVVMRCSDNLQVLAEGRFRSPGLVASREFEHAIQELREQHHVVIIHAPSFAKAEDLRPLGPLAQGVVIVQPGQSPKVQFGDDPLRELI